MRDIETDSQLIYTASEPQMNKLLVQVISQLEKTFPQRILACYLTGSVVTNTMVAGSDLDVIVVFKGAFLAGETAVCRQLGKQWQPKPPYELDLEPVCEADLLQHGATGLKVTAVPLYGSDIRDQIPWEPLANFRRDVAIGFLEYASQLRGIVPPLTPPLAYPDPQHFFWGYARAGTRLVLKTVLIGATLRVLLASGVRCGSKADAVVKYRQHVGGHWSDWLATLHEQCKMSWEYQIPATPSEQEALRSLLRPALAFENETLRPLIKLFE